MTAHKFAPGRRSKGSMNVATELKNVIKKSGFTSNNSFAHAVHVDPSYITRVCHGTRELGVVGIECVTSGEAPSLDKARLWWAAGYVPPEFRNLNLDATTYKILLALAS